MAACVQAARNLEQVAFVLGLGCGPRSKASGALGRCCVFRCRDTTARG